MGKSLRLLFVVSIVALSAALIAPATTSAQGGGGIIIEGQAGTGLNTLHPFFCSDTSCQRVVGFLYQTLLAADGETGQWSKDAKRLGGLATDWKVSADGKVYTFTIRDDLKWSDGKPVTAADVAYTFKTVTNKDTGSRYAPVGNFVEKMEATDAKTLVVTYKDAECTALDKLAGLGPIGPAHVLGEDYKGMKTAPFATNPNVSAGQLKFQDFKAGEQTTLVANPDWPADTRVKVDGYLVKIVPDQTVLVEQFLAGATNIIDSPALARRADVRKLGDDKKAQVYKFGGNSWAYIGLNLADPKNPQPGLDKDGKVIDQGKHPIFSDAKVRKALSLALNVDAMMEKAVFGEGTRIPSYSVPASWAFSKDVKLATYDQKAAAALLDEAGWKVGADGIRAKDGVKFEFSLVTNKDNSSRVAIGELAQNQLKGLGITVNFTPVDFNLLVEQAQGQKFDAFILGWRNGFPDNPDSLTGIFTPESDLPGSGNNFTSYNNPKVTELRKKASTLAGCDLKERGKIYGEIQQTLADDLPYIFLFVQDGMYAARSNVQGFNPKPSQMFKEIEKWLVVSK